MYKTLYRKYRPQSFKDVVGQENIVKVLSNAIIHSKIAHAYLFCGPRGTGKTSFAKIFAKIVNCENLNGVEPCCECNCCKQIANKNFLDIIEIDAASNNGVDEIREIKNKINLAPNVGKYKVYIIDEVHMLSMGAFNALLKTLEEPPAHIIFILATTEPHKLPITVISRCQRFEFKKFLNSEIEDNLRKICISENLDINDDVLKEIAVLSDGGMRDAIGLLDQLGVYQSDNISIDDLYQLTGTLSISNEIDFFNEYFSGNISKCLDNLLKYEEQGKNFVKIADDFLYILEQILKYKIIVNYDSSNDRNLKDKYLQIADKISKEKLCSLISNISDILKNLKNTSKPRILLEMVLMMEYSNKEQMYDVKENVISSKDSNLVNIEKKSVNKKIKANNVTSLKELSDEEVSIYRDFILDSNDIDSISSIRINNALATANKSFLNSYKERMPLILEYMFNENYSSIVCNLQDNELRVAGEKHLIFSLKQSSTVNILNEKIYLVDELFSKIFNNNVKCIFITDDDWLNIKNDYVKRLKENFVYEIMHEPDFFEEGKDLKNDKNSDLEGIFGEDINDIIEVR